MNPTIVPDEVRRRLLQAVGDAVIAGAVAEKRRKAGI